MSNSISVAMTTFNGERYLKAQLDSLATQRALPLELQIGDDGSTDSTEEIVRSFSRRAPFPVHFHRNEVTLGYGENFLRTAARCRGAWIAFCDQDDVWLPIKLEAVSRAIFNSPPGVALIAHNAAIINEDEADLDTFLLERLPNRVHGRFALPAQWLCAGFRQIFHRDLITQFDINERIGTPGTGQDNTGFDKRPHDGWIPFLANMTARIRTLDADLVCYRRHRNNSTALLGRNAHSSASLVNNADTYLMHARWHSRAAEALIRSAVHPDERRVVRGRQRLQAEADWLRRRSDLYCAQNASTRLTLIGRQILSGAYHRSWGLGPRSLVKDAAFAICGPGLLSTLSHIAQQP